MLTSLLGSTLYSLTSLFTTQLLFRGKAKHPFACLYNRVCFNFLTHHKKEESMWTMGYNDGSEFNIPTDSFNGRRLRPLIPRPNNTTPTNTITTPTPNCPGRLHGTDFFSLNNHLAAMGGCDQGKRELSQAGVVVSSSRWNPTPEQLRTLEELYRRGTRTPSADQIQHITAQLRRYGKIEGKNVFYWFQNHKARERQKRRRQMEYSGPDHPLVQPQVFERKDSSSAGGSRTGFEGEQTKNWVPSTNFSTLAEESVTTSRGAGIAECCRVDGWIQLEEGELEHRKSCFIERNGTWQMKQLSRPSPSHHHHLINPTTCCCSAATPPTTTSCTPAAAAATNGTGIATTTTSTSASKLPSATTKRTMDPTNQLIKGRHDLNIFIAPYRATGDAALINHFRHSAINEEEEEDEDQEDQDDGTFDPFGEYQTLQLFPLRSCGNTNSGIIINQKLDFTHASSVAAMNNNANLLMSSTTTSSSCTSPCPFFEFLPLKN